MPGAGSGITVNGDSGDNSIAGSPLDDTLAGHGGNDTLSGLAGDDLLYGGAGDDLTDGGPGNDWHFVDGAADRIAEAAGEGNDRVFASAGYVLAAGVSIERMSTDNHAGTAAIDLTGNELANPIYGNAGNNVLNGGAGADTLVGWAGDDWFYVDNSGDVVVEAGGEGSDRVFASVSYRLAAGAEVERMSTTSHGGTAAIDLTGNELANFIFGNEGTNVLNGRGGDDTLFGQGGTDTLDGGAGGDLLDGGEGNDVLVGGLGADTLSGGGGDDWYFADDEGDVVAEVAGEGTDRLFASASYALTAGASVERMSTDNHAGTTAINLTGNELANIIYGNAGNNILDGGAGADTLFGWTGDDTFIVDNAGDRAFEAPGEGADLIILANLDMAAAGFQLPSNIEDLRVVESMRFSSLYGNSLDNRLYGNSGPNHLHGGPGNDLLYGYAGNDKLWADSIANTTLVGGTGDDTYEMVPFGITVVEAAGEGSDTIEIIGGAYTPFVLAGGQEIEFIRPYDFALNGFDRFDFTGNEFGQTLTGTLGENVLDGKGGNDVLSGRSGADTLVFSTAPGPGNVDRIVGFASGSDRIHLDNAVFQSLSDGALPVGAFRTGTAAGDADDRIIYDDATGALWFDRDGSGTLHSAIQFATLDGAPAIGAGDFLVI